MKIWKKFNTSHQNPKTIFSKVGDINLSALQNKQDHIQYENIHYTFTVFNIQGTGDFVKQKNSYLCEVAQLTTIPTDTTHTHTNAHRGGVAQVERYYTLFKCVCACVCVRGELPNKFSNSFFVLPGRPCPWQSIVGRRGKLKAVYQWNRNWLVENKHTHSHAQSVSSSSRKGRLKYMC